MHALTKLKNIYGSKIPAPRFNFPFPEIIYFFYGKHGTTQNVPNSTNNLFVIIKVYSVNYRKVDNSIATKNNTILVIVYNFDVLGKFSI